MKSNYVNLNYETTKEYEDHYDILRLRCPWSISVLDRRYLVGVPVKNEE